MRRHVTVPAVVAVVAPLFLLCGLRPRCSSRSRRRSLAYDVGYPCASARRRDSLRAHHAPPEQTTIRISSCLSEGPFHSVMSAVAVSPSPKVSVRCARGVRVLVCLAWCRVVLLLARMRVVSVLWPRGVGGLRAPLLSARACVFLCRAVHAVACARAFFVIRAQRRVGVCARPGLRAQSCTHGVQPC